MRKRIVLQIRSCCSASRVIKRSCFDPKNVRGKGKGFNSSMSGCVDGIRFLHFSLKIFWMRVMFFW
ncbi:unnamed protein product [Schistosoma mattheei]|uniref:Uncharacterized protein n=1 Tax=Schistosoma mattheei TaxID=31246 RepID=A0A3P8EKV7_9TREM|nr:unnamed protein product [Schistosoma mattheei]